MGIYEQHIAKQMHHIHLLWHAGLQEYKFEYLQKQFKDSRTEDCEMKCGMFKLG